MTAVDVAFWLGIAGVAVYALYETVRGLIDMVRYNRRKK